MHRRALLRRIGAVAVVGSLSGCQRLNSTATLDRYASDIENYSDQSHWFHNRVLVVGDIELFQYRGEVTNDNIVSKVFRGEPETIQVLVNDEAGEQSDWPTIECGDTGPAPKAEVKYGATTDMDEIHLQVHCGSFTETDS